MDTVITVTVEVFEHGSHGNHDAIIIGKRETSTPGSGGTSMMGISNSLLDSLQNPHGLQFGGTPMNIMQQFGLDGMGGGGMMGMQHHVQQPMDTGGMNPFMEVKMETEDSPPEMKPDVEKLSEYICLDISLYHSVDNSMNTQ